ncbi:MAG: hypothetical protein OEY38_22285 [Gammaproteobacteria bacterium]|nr:hypothetical protein [Gammaproteobacteria bacterium]
MPDIATLERIQPLFGILESYGTANYLQIEDNIQNCVYKFGFSYLNSDQASKDHSELSSEDFKIIQKINDPIITERYEFWLKMNLNCEKKMINQVYNYSTENIFQRAAFLIGAGHRESIIRTTKELSNDFLSNIEWRYGSKVAAL